MQIQTNLIIITVTSFSRNHWHRVASNDHRKLQPYKNSFQKNRYILKSQGSLFFENIRSPLHVHVFTSSRHDLQISPFYLDHTFPILLIGLFLDPTSPRSSRAIQSWHWYKGTTQIHVVIVRVITAVLSCHLF